MKKRCILIVLFLFSFILCAVNKAEAIVYTDNFTFTQIDLIYSDTSLNTSITGLNLSAVFHSLAGSENTVVLSNAYTVPDGTITGLTIYATYTLGGGRGSGTVDWTPSTNLGFPIAVSGSKRITIKFYYSGTGALYYPSSVTSE